MIWHWYIGAWMELRSVANARICLLRTSCLETQMPVSIHCSVFPFHPVSFWVSIYHLDHNSSQLHTDTHKRHNSHISASPFHPLFISPVHSPDLSPTPHHSSPYSVSRDYPSSLFPHPSSTIPPCPSLHSGSDCPLPC